MIDDELENKENIEKQTNADFVNGNISSHKWNQDKYGNWILEAINKDEANEFSQPKDKSLEKKILNNTERIKQETFVMTEWGIGKVTKIVDDIATVLIEGNPVEFHKETLTTSLPIYLCILCKDNTYWIDLIIEFFYNISILKSKIAQFMKCHHSQIIIIHKGAKVDKKNLSLMEMGIYERDILLVVIKDPQELNIIRTRSAKTVNKVVIYNAIKFSVPHNIIITGMGFYKNKNIDVYYDLFIFEEVGNYVKLVFSEKKITVKKDEFEECEVFKHKINNIEIKSNTTYQIHQYLNSSDKNQYFGTKGSENIQEKNTLINFKFSVCEIPGRINSTDVEEGMIPAIYFYVI